MTTTPMHADVWVIEQGHAILFRRSEHISAFLGKKRPSNRSIACGIAYGRTPEINDRA